MQISVSEVIKKVDIRYKVAFLCTFIVGLLSQGMGLFNKFSVWDDVTNYGAGMTYEIGRWMLDILARFEVFIFGDDNFSLSTYNGFIGILFIALSACVVIEILDIKDAFICAFIAGIMVAFPVITCIFAYMFTLHFYMISLFIGCLGTYFICKKEKWPYWVLGIVLITMSVGIYQAFIPVVTTIMCIYLIGYCNETGKISDIVRKIVVVGCSCVLFLGLYYVVNSLYLKALGKELVNYRGMAEVGSVSIGVYIVRAISAFKEVLVPKTDMTYFMFPGGLLVAYRVALVMAAVMSIVMLIRVFKKNKIAAVLCAILVLVLPVSINLIVVMVERAYIHALMVYAHLFIFVYLAWLIERVGFAGLEEKVGKCLSIIAAVGMIVVLLMFCRLDNKCYLKASYAQMDAISYATTLITEIKSVDGYKSDMPVAFINSGNVADSTLQSGDLGHLEDIQFIPYYDVRGYVNSYSFRDFMIQWCGFNPPRADEVYFTGLDEVKEMPHYPDEGSIKIIEDTVVVNY